MQVVIKGELLNSLKENEDEDEPVLHEIVKNTKEPEEANKVSKRYDTI